MTLDKNNELDLLQFTELTKQVFCITISYKNFRTFYKPHVYLKNSIFPIELVPNKWKKYIKEDKNGDKVLLFDSWTEFKIDDKEQTKNYNFLNFIFQPYFDNLEEYYSKKVWNFLLKKKVFDSIFVRKIKLVENYKETKYHNEVLLSTQTNFLFPFALEEIGTPKIIKMEKTYYDFLPNQTMLVLVNLIDIIQLSRSELLNKTIQLFSCSNIKEK
ncbi:MAG: hypothetical protein ACRC4M_05195 [Mycoplasma sp.]